eukprot:403371726
MPQSLLRFSFALSLLLTSLPVYQSQELVNEDLNLAVSQEHYLDFPMNKKDFQNWNSTGTTLPMKSRLVLVPQSKDAKGLFYNHHKNPYPEAWLVDLEVKVGNTQNHNKVASVFGFYYLRDVDPRIHADSVVGYSSTFNGLGVFMSTQGSTSTPNRQIANTISVIVGDGKRVYTRPVNSKNHCYRTYRNLPEDVYMKVRIKYENGLISVSTFDQATNQFEDCTQYQIDPRKMNYEGYFALAAGSGLQYQDYVYIKSFKLFQPGHVAENHHFQQARRAKSTKEAINNLMKQEVKNMFEQVHNTSNQEVNQADHKNMSQFFSLIPHKHMNLSHTLEKVIVHEDVNQQRYMALVQSLPQKTAFTNQMEKVYIFKNALNTITFEVDQQMNKLMTFEKSIKRIRYQRDLTNSVMTREVKNRQTDDINEALLNLQSKMQILKRHNDQLVFVLQQMEEHINDEVKSTGNLYKRAKVDRNQQFEGQVLYEMREIDELFDNMEQNGVGSRSVSMTLLNMGMVFVVMASGYVWFKLNQFENKYR